MLPPQVFALSPSLEIMEWSAPSRISRLTFHVSHLQEARLPPDSPDVLIRRHESRRHDRYPATSRRYLARDHRVSPSSSPVSQPQSAPYQSHGRHHDCSSETLVRHTSRLPASERKSDRRATPQEDMEPAAEPLALLETQPSAPTHALSARSDTT